MNRKAKIILIVWLLAFIAQGRAENLFAEELNRRTIEWRAVEAVIWGMPAVNYDLMRQEMFAKTKGKENEIL